MKTKRLFITGTNTDVGKTYAACALLRALNEKGLATVGLKPLASGSINTAEGLRSQDALALQEAASVKLDYVQLNPIQFAEPIAPHIAAELNNQKLSVEALLKACAPAFDIPADYLIIEGAGGWLVPLNEHETLADFAAQLEAEIVLVVGMQLGCINHSLLTIHNIQSRGLKLAGWVANCIDPNMLNLEENITSLKQRIQAPLLATLPYQDNPVSCFEFEL